MSDEGPDLFRTRYYKGVRTIRTVGMRARNKSRPPEKW